MVSLTVSVLVVYYNSMNVESAVVLVLLENSVIVKNISGIVKIHLYVMVVLA